MESTNSIHVIFHMLVEKKDFILASKVKKREFVHAHMTSYDIFTTQIGYHCPLKLGMQRNLTVFNSWGLKPL